MERKNVVFFVLLAGFLAFLFWSQMRLSTRSTTDNDEGIYLTTLLLISKGHPAYKDTFLSQPPIFILSVYPFFAFLGKTLAAARIAVGFWSLAGLVAVAWIGWELNRKWLGFLAAGLLYLIPHYAGQTLILQSDSIASAFSVLSLALFISFLKRKKAVFYAASVIFFNLAFWTKLDITLIPVFAWGLAACCRKRILKLTGIGAAVSLFIFLVFIAPFGIGQIFDNVLRLRLQAGALPQSPWRLIDLLFSDPLLLILVIAALFITPSVIARQGNLPIRILAVWSYTAFALLASYRPLFDHHLSILSVPAVLAASAFAYDRLLRNGSMLLTAGTAVIVTASIASRLVLITETGSFPLTASQKMAVSCIEKYTSTNDMIVSDEEILMPASGRLPPPWLSDVSYVRISSGNLTPQKFKSVIKAGRPKMVIAWNGRLQTLKNFNQLLENYAEIPCSGENINQKMYIRNQ